MSEASEHLELLKNAVRQPIAALTAVETDTVYRANELAKLLAAEIGERPNDKLSLCVEAGASLLLDQARKISENWIDEQGVLFVIDDGGNEADKQRYSFWVEMNGLRESWAALNCHVVFFLLPDNYQMLLNISEHFSDWLPLKLHIFFGSDDELIREDFIKFNTSRISPQVAIQQLSILENRLIEALKKGVEQSILVRRYYLPMFEASMRLGDISRAEKLIQNISESDVPNGELTKWWFNNFELCYYYGYLDKALFFLEKCFDHTIATGNIHEKATFLYQMGNIAEQTKSFEMASKCYIQSLEITKQIGDKYGEAIIYDQLGNINYQLYNYNMSEKWYNKSLEINIQIGDKYGEALIYHNLGILAHDSWNLNKAEQWYKKSLMINEMIMAEHNLSYNYHNLGILARQQGRLESSGEWLIKSIKAFANTNDPENAEKAKEEFRKTYAQASPDVRAKLKGMWEAAGLSEPGFTGFED